MRHLTRDELSARLDGALAPAKAADADRHLAECQTCRDALAGLAAQDDALGRLLDHDPGEAYFESFAARVEDRIRAAGLRGAQARSWDGGVFAWLRSPRRLAMAGVVAAVVVGAALVVLTARLERPEHDLLESRPVARAIAPPAAPSDQKANEEAAAPSSGLTQGSRPPAKNERIATGTAPAPEPQALAKQSAGPEAMKDQALETRPEVAAREPAASGAAQGRAMAAPRTDADAGTGARSQPSATFAPPPSAAPRGGTLAQRKAAPAERQSLTRDESKLESFASPPAAQNAAPGVSLCGSVVNAQGRPVVGAVVAVADLGMTTQTDAQGGFCFTTPAGTHPITVFAVGYQQLRVDARAGEAAPLTIQLRPVPVLENPMAASPSLDTRESDVAGAFAGAPAPVRERVAQAQALYAKAKASGAAADYDAAAARWQQVLPGRSGAALQEARFRLAEARFQAWQAGPSPARAHAATDALIAYLRYAPTGPKRDQAASWLTRVLR